MVVQRSHFVQPTFSIFVVTTNWFPVKTNYLPFYYLSSIYFICFLQSALFYVNTSPLEQLQTQSHELELLSLRYLFSAFHPSVPVFFVHMGNTAPPRIVRHALALTSIPSRPARTRFLNGEAGRSLYNLVLWLWCFQQYLLCYQVPIDCLIVDSVIHFYVDNIVAEVNTIVSCLLCNFFGNTYLTCFDLRLITNTRGTIQTQKGVFSPQRNSTGYCMVL